MANAQQLTNVPAVAVAAVLETHADVRQLWSHRDTGVARQQCWPDVL